MIERVAPVRPSEAAVTPEAIAPTTAAPTTTFGDLLAGLVEDAATRQRSADHQADQLAIGRSDDLHGTMIAGKEAEISLKLVGAIRNKLLDAFHEIWRTNV